MLSYITELSTALPSGRPEVGHYVLLLSQLSADLARRSPPLPPPPSLPPTWSQDTVSAIEAFAHVAHASDAQPYLDELGPRVEYVEKELAEASEEAKRNGSQETGYLCGSFSYADLFTLPIVLLCVKYQLGTISPAIFPHTAKWVKALMDRPSGDCQRVMSKCRHRLGCTHCHAETLVVSCIR